MGGVLGAERPQLVARQGHNRFYQTISQALRYQAASDISEAFYLFYRKANDPIDHSGALSERHHARLKAWSRYQELLGNMFSPASSKVLLGWPMTPFKGHGDQWLAEMHAVMGDRLSAVREIVDPKRRIFVTSTTQDYLFVQDLMHMEYLAQAFLLRLQEAWQGENLQYAGHGPDAWPLRP